jgi:hypothetical protein
MKGDTLEREIKIGFVREIVCREMGVLETSTCQTATLNSFGEMPSDPSSATSLVSQLPHFTISAHP